MMPYNAGNPAPLFSRKRKDAKVSLKAKRKRKNSVLGLDLGSHSVKALEMTRNGSVLTISNCALADIPDAESYGNSVGAVLEAGEFEADKVAIGVSGRGTLLRLVTVQGDKTGDFKNLVRKEAAKLLAYDVDDALLDYHIDSHEHGRAMSLLLAAARRDAVLEKLAMLEKAGIHPQTVNLELIAMANASDTLYGSGKTNPSGHPRCLVDFGASKTLIVVTDGAQHLFREFPFGGVKLTEMIAHRMGRPFAQAEAIKLDPGERMDMVKDAIYPGIEDLTAEIRACLLGYKELSGGRETKQLFLSGGLAHFSGVVTLMGKMLRVQSQTLNPFAVLGTEDMDLAFLEANAHRFAVAFGLACQARN